MNPEEPRRKQAADELKRDSWVRSAAEQKLLLHFWPVIWAGRERLRSVPEYFFTSFGRAYVSLAMLGGGKLTLGMLALLWEELPGPGPCPVCGDQTLFIGAGGSPFSGSHSVTFLCPGCLEIASMRSANFMPTALRALEILREHTNEPVIRKGKRPIYTIAQGLVGEYVPDVVLKPAVVACSLKQMIRELLVESGSQGLYDVALLREHDDDSWPDASPEVVAGFLLGGQSLEMGPDGRPRNA